MQISTTRRTWQLELAAATTARLDFSAPAASDIVLPHSLQQELDLAGYFVIAEDVP